MFAMPPTKRYDRGKLILISPLRYSNHHASARRESTDRPIDNQKRQVPYPIQLEAPALAHHSGGGWAGDFCDRTGAWHHRYFDLSERGTSWLPSLLLCRSLAQPRRPTTVLRSCRSRLSVRAALLYHQRRHPQVSNGRCPHRNRSANGSMANQPQPFRRLANCQGRAVLDRQRAVKQPAVRA